MASTINELLVQLKAPGTFAARLQVPADALAISVTGVGPLSFPITTRTAQKLRAIAQPSPFGLQEQTLHDPAVRNSWEIPARRVKIGARGFQPVLNAQLQTLRAALGFPEGCELKAEMDKLLIYEKGQFFKPHQDSEKHDDMVATLVVVLPSEYSGGTLTVEHQGETKSFRRLASQSTELAMLAFYADCYHAVSPVTRGVRVVLTYRLAVVNRDDKVRPQTHSTLVHALADALKTYFSNTIVKPYSKREPAPPQRFVYLLDHEYTQHSLAWTRLKNSDNVRVTALRAVAERLDCECFLALADVHEAWMCPDGHPKSPTCGHPKIPHPELR